MGSDTIHQIVGFHFRVVFLKLPEGEEVDMKFQSISGLDVQIEKEALKEGGVNGFEHSVPGRRKYTTLTLKRGIVVPENSGLTTWCQNAFHKMIITPIETAIVELLNPDHQTMMKWTLSHVWPVSWKVAELNAERGEVLIETLELNYNYFKVDPSKT